MAGVPFDRFAAELRSLYRPPQRAKATWAKMRQVLDELAAIDTVHRTSDLTPMAVADWVSSHPMRSPATQLSLLRTLRSATRYARQMGYLRVDPFEWRGPSRWVIRPKLADDAEDPTTIDRHLSSAEVGRLLDQADREALGGSWRALRLRALIYTYAYTGMRKNEVLGMRASDVELSRRILYIRPNSRRGLKTAGSAAPLAIAGELAEVLGEWLTLIECPWLFPGLTRTGPWLHGPVGGKALDEVKALGDRAGIRGTTILGFRHTIGTLAEGWGLGELELQRWLRHTRVRTQDHYRKADLDNLQRTAGKICFRRTGQQEAA